MSLFGSSYHEDHAYERRQRSQDAAEAPSLRRDVERYRRAYDRLAGALTHVINRVSTEGRDDEHGHIFTTGEWALQWAEWELDGTAAERAKEAA